MTLVLTQSDFRANLTKYLDQVNDDEIVYIVRSNSRSVAVLSQKMDSNLEFLVFVLIFTLIPNLFSSWDFT